MVIRDRFRGRMIRAVRIEPRVDEDAAFVGFGDEERERVESLCLAHLPGQEFRPGLEARFVDRVGHRSDLEDDGVKPQLFGEIETCQQFGFLRVG